jgi:hypothetical protein
MCKWMRLARFGTLLIAFLCACGRTGEHEPVPECVQYEAKMSACFHRDSGFASQPSLIPKTDADRDRIREICLTNLERLQVACR